MSSYVEFFLNSPSRIKQFELLEISHPNFTKVYRIVRNKVGGLTVSIDGEQQFFQHYPLRITSKGIRADMDYGIQVDLGDLGEIIPMELDAVAAADGFGTLPAVRYWTFRSDDLSAPMFGPIKLVVTNFPITRTGASFEAVAPTLNANRTGELYLPSRFPMLNGLL